MAIKSYLIFSLHQTRYAIAAGEVREVFSLPELTSVADAPSDVIGLLNLHSNFVPVMHLDLRFGHKFEGCNLTDSIIVVESGQLQVGVVVDRVETVVEIDDRYIQADLTYGRTENINRAFVKSIINLDDEMIILLDVNNLVRHPNALQELVDSDGEPLLETTENDFYQRYFSNASSKTKHTLHQRAIALKSSTEEEAIRESIPIAVMSIDDNYFGIDLGIVREFIPIGKFTIIPCCPDFVIGNMNLRGEILTLVDIRQPLDLTTGNQEQKSKAVVVEVENSIVGIVVDEVYDVIDLYLDELKPTPVATKSHTATYIKGIISDRQQTINLIDLPKLLTQGAMTVELTA